MQVGGGCAVLYGFFFFQAEDGIRYLVRSRGLGDVYKRQGELSRGMPLIRRNAGTAVAEESAAQAAHPSGLKLSLIHI